MAPGVKDDAFAEGLAPGGDHDGIVLAQSARVRIRPMQLEGGEAQALQLAQQVLRPMETESAFPEARVDEDVLEMRGADRAIIVRQASRNLVSAFGQTMRLSERNCPIERTQGSRQFPDGRTAGTYG